jgi:hypothetical protein
MHIWNNINAREDDFPITLVFPPAILDALLLIGWPIIRPMAILERQLESSEMDAMRGARMGRRLMAERGI